MIDREPRTVDLRHNIGFVRRFIAGHGRVEAAKLLGMGDIPQCTNEALPIFVEFMNGSSRTVEAIGIHLAAHLDGHSSVLWNHDIAIDNVVPPGGKFATCTEDLDSRSQDVGLFDDIPMSEPRRLQEPRPLVKYHKNAGAIYDDAVRYVRFSGE